jgi:hypothetical protein
MTAVTVAEAGTLVRLRRAGEFILSTYFILTGLLFAATTLYAIVNFAWRQPMFDQWREYETLLGLPFPQDALQLANGHRPILPNLIRLLEINWFQGNQALQITIGSLCAFLSAAILAISAWRERSLSVAARCAGVMFSVLGVLWLANARRLLHGSEALHGYMPTFAALCAIVCVYRAHERRSLIWMTLSCLACVCATFSFGLGLAAFGSVLVLAILLRMPARHLAMPLATLCLCVTLYVIVLPGNEAVRGQIVWQPLEIVRITAEWIAAPWKIGWLEFADNSAPAIAGYGWIERVLSLSAGSLLGLLGGSADHACVALGVVGVLIFFAFATHIFVRDEAVTRLETVAIGTGVYALASALITVLGRLEYFHQLPDQIYADRYLAWPSLFWCALALLALRPIARLRRASVNVIGLAAAVALPIALIVTHEGGAIWGALVYRGAQQTAAELRSGIYDEQHFPGVGLGREDNLHEIALLRDHRLAMFADPAWQRLGTRWSGSLDPTTSMAVEAHWSSAVTDAGTDRPAAHIEGWVTRGIAALQRSGQFVILSPDQIIVGFAEFTFIRPYSRSLLLTAPRKRGFDGYVHDYLAADKYTLAVVDFARNRGIPLATLPPTSPVSP